MSNGSNIWIRVIWRAPWLLRTLPLKHLTQQKKVGLVTFQLNPAEHLWTGPDRLKHLKDPDGSEENHSVLVQPRLFSGV